MSTEALSVSEWPRLVISTLLIDLPRYLQHLNFPTDPKTMRFETTNIWAEQQFSVNY